MLRSEFGHLWHFILWGVKTLGPIGKYFKNYSSIRKRATPWNYLNLQIILSQTQIHLTVVSHLCLILLHTNSILDRRKIFGSQSKDILSNQIRLRAVCGYPINNTNTCFCHIIAVDRITHINIMQISNKMITSPREQLTDGKIGDICPIHNTGQKCYKWI